MPRPTTEELYGTGRGTPTYGPDSPSNFTTSVVAPLTVDAAPSQAVALAAALGHFNTDIAQPYLSNQKDQAAQQQAQQNSNDAARGAADASINNIDPDLQAKSQAYANAVHQTLIQRDVNNASATVQQKWSNDWANIPLQDTTDDNGNPVKGKVSLADDYFKAQFGGLEGDPAAAKIIGPVMQHTLGELLGADVHAKTVGYQQTAVNNATASILQSVQSNGAVPYTRDDLMSDYQNKILPLFPNDPAGARAALVTAVSEGSIHAKDPDIIDKYLPAGTDFGNGATFTPAEQLHLDEARDRATVLSKGDQTMASYAMASKFQDIQSNGQQIPESQIKGALSNGLISEGAALSLHGKNAEIARNQADAQSWSTFFASGAHWSTTGLDPVDVRKHEDNIVSYLPDAQRIPSAIALTATQGLMPTNLKQFLGSPALQSQQGLQQQLNAYAELRQRAPAAVAADVPESARAVYDRAMDLSKTGMQPSAILTELQSYDPEVAKQTTEAARPAIDAALKQGVTMKGAPGTGGLFSFGGGSSQSIADYTNAPQITQMVREQAQALVGRGFDPAKAVNTAAQNVYNSSVSVKTPQGLLMIPRVGGEAPDVGDAVSYLFKNGVPDVAKDNGISPSDVRLAVQPGTQGRSSLVLVGPSGQTLRGPFTLNDLYAAYTKQTSIDKWQAGQAARAATEAHHNAYSEATQAIQNTYMSGAQIP